MAFRHLTSLEDRLMKKVSLSSAVSGCWIWTGYVNKAGYGMYGVNYKRQMAHRISYELFVGPIPKYLELDHLCRVRNCINPLHLEAVTCRENLRRSPICMSTIRANKTHCLNGHAFDEANTYKHNGHRWCRKCHLMRQKLWDQTHPKVSRDTSTSMASKSRLLTKPGRSTPPEVRP